MRKQYRYYETTSFRYILEIYHNVVLVSFCKYWATEIDEEVDKLLEQGYTYGYTDKEVEEARAIYEKMLNNKINIDRSNNL